MKSYMKSIHFAIAAGLLLTTSMNVAWAQRGGSKGGASRGGSFGNSSMKMSSGSFQKSSQSNMNTKPLQARPANLNKLQTTATNNKPTVQKSPSLVSNKPSASTMKSVNSQQAGLKKASTMARAGNISAGNTGLAGLAKSHHHKSFNANFYCGTGWGNHHHHGNHWGHGWRFGYQGCFGYHGFRNHCYSPWFYNPCFTSYCYPYDPYCYTTPVVCQPVTQYVSIIEQEAVPVTVKENVVEPDATLPVSQMDNSFITGSVVGG